MFGLDPKDPKDWSKLLPFLKKTVELADSKKGPIVVNNGDPGKIVYYFKNFADKGVEICVKIFYTSSGGAAKISDEWTVR